jgi:hypothetical protein
VGCHTVSLERQKRNSGNSFPSFGSSWKFGGINELNDPGFSDPILGNKVESCGSLNFLFILKRWF